MFFLRIWLCFIPYLGTSSLFHDFDMKPQPALPIAFKPPRPGEPNGWDHRKFFSNPDRSMHAQFISDVANLILDEAVFFNDDNPPPPTKWMAPRQLKKVFDFTVGEEGTDHSGLLGILREVIKYSPKPSHSFMLDKRVAGLDPYARLGDWAAVTMSNLVVVYQASPVWTLMEDVLVKELGKLVGWKNPEGVSTSGAGAANTMAVAVALQKKFPLLRARGYAAHDYPYPLIFVSEDASPAFRKAALYLGIPKDGIVKVKVDNLGRMDISDLKRLVSHYKGRKKEERFVLTAVVSTVGTPLLGAIDPVSEIDKVCKENNMWHHVDAEKGGGLLFRRSTKYQNLVKDIGKADSFTFGTWTLATPYVTTMIITKESDRLERSFGLHASYVWTGLDLYNGSYDKGDHTIQTSRRPEIAKLWFALNGRGKADYDDLAQKQFANKDKFSKLLKDDPRFELVLPEFELPLVGFWWIPWSSRDLNWDRNNATMWNTISSVNHQIKRRLFRDNIMQISLAPGGRNRPDYLLASVTNNALTTEDFQYILTAIKKYGEEAFFGSSDIVLEKAPTKSPNKTTAGIAPLKDLHYKLFRDVFQMFIKEGLFFHRNDHTYKFEQPQDLEQKMDFSIKEGGLSHDNLLDFIRNIIQFSPHWAHPYYIYQLATGLDPYTVAADYLVPALNTPMLTYEDSPIFTLMENEVLAALRQRVFGTTVGDGVITDGGSMANQLAIALARHRKDPTVKNGGFHAARKRFILYMSEDGHYSTTKGAIFQGYGDESLKFVVSTRIGQMDVQNLEAHIKRDLEDPENEPFMVVITTGTTIYGAIDNVEEIVQVCERYRLWCHVDGMFGGFTVMSDTFRKKFKGLERVDSWGADLHKLMGSSMVMTAFVSRHSGVFKETFGTRDPIDYYQKPGSLYNQELFDLGDKHWQVDKRNNLFKFWFIWKAKGRIGLGQHVDKILRNAKYLVHVLHRRTGFQPVIEDYELTNICFYYLPLWLREIKQDTKEFEIQVGHVSFSIEKSLTKGGIMNVVAQNRHWIMGDTPRFLKFVMMGSALREEDIDYLLDAVEFYGKDVKPLKPGEVREFQDAWSILARRFDPFGNHPKREHRDFGKTFAANDDRENITEKHTEKDGKGINGANTTYSEIVK